MARGRGGADRDAQERAAGAAAGARSISDGITQRVSAARHSHESAQETERAATELAQRASDLEGLISRFTYRV